MKYEIYEIYYKIVTVRKGKDVFFVFYYFTIFIALYQSASRDESKEPFSVVICGLELCKQDGITKTRLASNIHDDCPLRLVLFF